jgi:hypothetical protein
MTRGQAIAYANAHLRNERRRRRNQIIDAGARDLEKHKFMAYLKDLED